MRTRRQRRDEGGWFRSIDRKWLGRILAVGTGAFALGYVVTWALFFPGSNRPPVVTVPELRAMTPAAADRQLDEAGLELQIGDSLPNPEVPAGQVLSQSPLPGREVSPGTRVRVILSLGPERRTIPVVTALTRDQAVRILDANGFQTEVQEVPHLSAAGQVVGVEPAVGTSVRLPARVRLLVSAGPPLVAVPGLVGLTPDQARAALEQAGLRMGHVEYVFAGLEAQEVVQSQAPQPGDSIRQGQPVRVWVTTDQLPGIIIPGDRPGGTEGGHE